MGLKELLPRVALVLLLPEGLLISGKKADDDGPTISINPSVTYGSWEGWGTSLAWWANVFGQRDDLADAFWTMESVDVVSQDGEGTIWKALPGLGFNIARYNLGASAPKGYVGMAEMHPSPNIPEYRQIDALWLNWASHDPLNSSSWNWTLDANQVSMLKKAKARGADLFEIFSNSPVWWQLYNKNPSGFKEGYDNLQSWNYKTHAEYLAIVAEHAEQHWNVSFNSIEPFNEPSSWWWKPDNNQEGCHFGKKSMAKVIKSLAAEINERGLGAIVSASDENTYDEAVYTWRKFDDDTRTRIGRVNVHGYQEGDGRRDRLYDKVTVKAGKPIWNSEYGDGDASGMGMASNLHLDFQMLHQRAWVYWQVIDETGGWGLMRMEPDRKRVTEVNAKYWVLAQYTRHIRPGMTILHSKDKRTVAAYDPKQRRLVLVYLNKEKWGNEWWVTFDLTRFARVEGPVRQWRTSKHGSRYLRLPDSQVSGKSFKMEVEEDSIYTFEVDNVDLEELLIFA